MSQSPPALHRVGYPRRRAHSITHNADGPQPGMCTPSALTIGAKRHLGASGKTAASSKKRRALLDLLDQVRLSLGVILVISQPRGLS